MLSRKIKLDKTAAHLSDAIGVITADFTDILTQWGIEESRIHMIHKWVPLESINLTPRDNAWVSQHKLGDGVRFIYSGTLAVKHNPALLLELACMLDRGSAGELLVVSEGAGVEWLAEQAEREELRSLKYVGFQPFEALPDVMGSADVLVAILETDAGIFSVPSKVLSYLCAARPLLLAVPGENLAARIVADNGAGHVVEPSDLCGFCAAAKRLIDSPQIRFEQGLAARAYAEAHFDICQITNHCERILADN